MSGRIEQLLRNNQAFVAAQLASDPGYFERLSEGQHQSCNGDDYRHTE